MDNRSSAGREPPSFGIRQFLFVLFLAVIFLLLGHSMVRCYAEFPCHSLTCRCMIP